VAKTENRNGEKVRRLKLTWKQTELLMVFAILLVGVATVFSETLLIPFTSYGLIKLPSIGLLVITIAAISLVYITFQD